MSTTQKRDADMDRLLRAVLKTGPSDAAGECPDAAILAASVEGGLTSAEQSAFDAHVVGCGRCQEALAVLSHELPRGGEAAPAAGWFTWVVRPRLRWLVPVSAAATAAVVFFATRPLIAPEGEVPAAPAADVVQMAQAPSAPAEVPAAALEARRERSAAVPEKNQLAATARRDEEAKTVIDLPSAKPAVQAAEAALPAPAAIAPRKDARSLEADLMAVPAPGGHVVWRPGAGGRLWRSADAGETWHDQASGVTADLLAGAAPSPATCWIVGAAGTVLLTTDGERWERLPFPHAVDLVAVDATSARAATVTARDGRRFETLDAGLTWVLKQ